MFPLGNMQSGSRLIYSPLSRVIIDASSMGHVQVG
jgi:hypothetical protein